MTHLTTPLTATGWKNTSVLDAGGNTILLMPNGHKGLEAVQEACRLFAAAPELLEAVEDMVYILESTPLLGDEPYFWLRDAKVTINKARGGC